MESINNIETILPHLVFENEHDFYYVIILRRKKDQDVSANHQSSRTIKSYCIHSQQELLDKMDEIIGLCDFFKARCGINMSVFNHKDLALEVVKRGIEQIQSGSYKLQYLYEKVVGNAKSKNKRWMVDVDTKDILNLNSIVSLIDLVSPDNKKIEEIVPTYNGFHIITRPFNLELFNSIIPNDLHDVCGVHKNNFIALYYPTKNE